MVDTVTAFQQLKAACQQTRQQLIAYAQQHCIGRHASVERASYHLMATIVSVTPSGRVRFDDCGVYFDIEEIHVLDY